jgi:competence protein ComEA
MLKKILIAFSFILCSVTSAWAQVDVNKADLAALDGIKGLGPAKSQAILDARTKGGQFKDWSDLQTRVKGLGEKSAIKLSEAGLTVNGLKRTKDSTSAIEKPKGKVDEKTSKLGQNTNNVNKTDGASKANEKK